MPGHEGQGIPQNLYKTIPIDILNLATGTTPPAAVAVDRFRGYGYTVADDADFEFMVPNDWVLGTDIDVYFEWCCNETYAANTGEVNWQLDWETIGTGQVVGAGTVGTPNTTGDTAIPTAAREKTVAVLSLDAADLARRDLVRCILSRIALTGGGANPVQEPEVYSVVVEYAAYFSSAK